MNYFHFIQAFVILPLGFGHETDEIKLNRRNPLVPREPTIEHPSSSLFGICKGIKGLKSHETNCALFYNCWDKPSLDACPNGLLYHQEKGYCDYPFNVNCDQRIQLREEPITSSKCPFQWGIFNGPDCRSFYHCVAGFPHIMNCPAGLIFNEAIKACQHPTSRNHCTDSPSGICEPGEFRAHLAPDHGLSQFWLCDNGAPRLLSCLKGMHFDANGSKCVLPN